MEKTLNKAKINADGGLDLFYHEVNPNGGEDKKSLEDCEQAMLEPQAAALQALADVAIAICELPRTWKDDMEVVGFSLYGDEESRKVSISFKRKLKIGTPLVVNSPRRYFQCEEEFAKSCLSDKHALLIDQAEQAALSYLSGERSTNKELDFDDKQENRQQETMNYGN